MPSFISNSDARAPQLDYGRLFAAAGVLMVLGLALMEYSLRAAGCVVSYSDSHARWSLERSRLDHVGPHSLAVVGASRMHNDFNPHVFQSEYPGIPLVNLPESGVNPIPLLQDVVNNSNFAGTVLLAVTPFQMAACDQPHQPGGTPDNSSVAYYHQNFSNLGRLDDLANLKILMALQSHLVIFAEALTPDRMLGIRSRQPYTLDRDRYCRMDYSSFTARDLARLDPPGDPDNIAERASDAAFARSVEIVREANSTLSRRGGKLVLVRLPMSGNAWDVNRETLPKTQYWEKLAAETGAETIHWTEIPGLPEMSCRDGSHLDYRDAEVFTRYLLAELDRRGLLPAKSEPSGV